MRDTGVRRRQPRRAALAAAMAAVAAVAGGCGGGEGDGLSFRWKGGPTSRPQAVPEPIHLLLPQAIRIHPFTGTRVFDEAGGVRGLDVNIEAIDSFGEPTKAFGDFRFELYAHRPTSSDKRGKRIAVWTESLLEPEKNLTHWQIQKVYQFKLLWNRPIPRGQRFVLVAIFSSPFTERLFDQRVDIAGL